MFHLSKLFFTFCSKHAFNCCCLLCWLVCSVHLLTCVIAHCRSCSDHRRAAITQQEQSHRSKTQEDSSVVCFTHTCEGVVAQLFMCWVCSEVIIWVLTPDWPKVALSEKWIFGYSTSSIMIGMIGIIMGIMMGIMKSLMMTSVIKIGTIIGLGE